MKGWKKIKSKIIHQSSWRIYREDDVITPRGNIGKYYWVDNQDSVGIVAEDKQGKIFLVGQYRYPIGNKFSWEFPAGGKEKGESPLQAAKRELEEEAGLRAKKWKKIGFFYAANFLLPEKAHLFIASDLVSVKENPDPTELFKIKKFTVSEIKQLIQNQKITCGYTISLFYKYLLYKNSKL
ncbi:MAG: NUDIX hydrolase [Patescibacteria group bacterium]|nr:NUDIX hydrolase [Patescibacteria group bacterium]MDD4610822.1 NUDIX hydrolase [Patescibacteria group bacterium]